MRAIGYCKPAPLNSDMPFVEFDTPVPVPGPRDLLVAVRAMSVNPKDAKERATVSPGQKVPRILGFDAAGVVEAIGSEVSRFEPGDQVYYAGAINRAGSNAEYQVVDERLVGRKPTRLSFSATAALPLTTITAWELLFDRLGVTQGCHAGAAAILIINGAGGVGSILIQLARQLTHLSVIATASRQETVAWCRNMGAHYVVDHRGPIDVQLRDIGFPVVEYVASLSNTEQHLRSIVNVLSPQGKVAFIDNPRTLDITPFKEKSATLVWEMMFTRSLFQTSDLSEQGRLLDQVSVLIDSGHLQSTMKTNLGPLTANRLFEAHRAIESGKTVGKLVIDGFAPL